MWKIEKIVSKGDYNYVIVRDHPFRTKHDYVLEHRIVVENHLKRILDSNEVVHHKDGNKKNNVIENLEVLSDSLHRREHSKAIGRKCCIVKCPNCDLLFEKLQNKTHLSKSGRFTTCSMRCRGLFSRAIQLRGNTHEVEMAISVNILLEYRRFFKDNPEETH